MDPSENQALNISELKTIISETKLDKQETLLAEKVLSYATFGAPTGINPKDMPPIDVGGTGFVKDQIVGEQLADVFCSMLKSKFLAGFSTGPPGAMQNICFDWPASSFPENNFNQIKIPSANIFYYVR